MEVGTFPARGCSNLGLWCGIINGYDWHPEDFDLEDMRMYFISQHEAFVTMEGYFGPIYSFFSLDRLNLGSAKDFSFNPRLKVDDLIQTWFRGHADRRIVTIDGKTDDWERVSSAEFRDPRGDSRGSNDIVGMEYASDELYMYFRVDYSSPPDGFLLIEFDVQGSGAASFFLMLNNGMGSWCKAETIYHRDHPRVPIIGIADAVDGPTFIETRIPRPFLVDYWTGGPFSVRLVHADRNWNVHDETLWYRIDRP